MGKVEIRARCKLTGIWLFGTGVTDFLNVYPDGKGRLWLWSKDYCWHEIDPSSVCQSTGISDSGGELIYEGDRVSRYFEDGCITGLIAWNRDCAQFCFYPDCPEDYGQWHRIGKGIDMKIIH